MAAVTDLTYQQLLNKLPAGAVVVTAGKVMVDVSLVTGTLADAMSDTSVIKFIAKFMDAAYAAQQTANIGQTAGERLAAVSGANQVESVGSLVSLSRTFTLKHALIPFY